MEAYKLSKDYKKLLSLLDNEIEVICIIDKHYSNRNMPTMDRLATIKDESDFFEWRVTISTNEQQHEYSRIKHNGDMKDGADLELLNGMCEGVNLRFIEPNATTGSTMFLEPTEPPSKEQQDLIDEVKF